MVGLGGGGLGGLPFYRPILQRFSAPVLTSFNGCTCVRVEQVRVRVQKVRVRVLDDDHATATRVTASVPQSVTVTRRML